ncbi:hypothetical protein B0J18DRAFT_220121 [Chaetomium sp. MPI-SDFR-AT-0129]|nr:hypothetical protein B0J18DRAFT_220121 [Chaetomium sp. MPI-SDFR-AT-0129]
MEVPISPGSGSALATQKPYHPKRPHRKSRTGCRNCKTRRVKCDEGRPACRSCTLREERCVYTVPPRPAQATAHSTTTTSPSPEPPRGTNSRSNNGPSSGDEAPYPDLFVALRNQSPSVTPQPQFIPAGHNMVDMRLLWFYATVTFASFSTGHLEERNADPVLKVTVVQHAFANDFLMNCILGLSAMHINHLGLRNMGVSPALEIRYRAKAFETYRKALTVANSAAYPALVATSLLLCGLSTHVFRGNEAQPLSILNWMTLWKGIDTIIDEANLPLLYQSGIAPLIFRPSVDVDASARCLPSNLLFMLSSVNADDPDYPYIEHYYRALQFLGSIYLELSAGFSVRLFLRIATFLSFLPQNFVNAAREKRPRALVILAHYLVFTKFKVGPCWWMDGIADFEIPNIINFLGPEWQELLRIPAASLEIEDNRALVRLLVDDPSWDRSTVIVDDQLGMSEHESKLAIRAVMAHDTSPEVTKYRRDRIRFDV